MKSILFLFVFIQAAFGHHEDLTAEERGRRAFQIREYNEKYRPSKLYQSLGKYDPFRKSGLPFYNRYLRNPKPLGEEFSFEKLEGLIEQGKAQSIEDLISELPYEMKNDNYVLMYRSLSLQEASPIAPRAILYSPTARFILSFNGGQGQLGSDVVETVQFDLESQKFEFREIDYSVPGKVKISEPNPKKCMECHQSQNRVNIDLRPNWEPYATWVGAFGSDSGKFNNKHLSKKPVVTDKKLSKDSEALTEQEYEFEYFKHYINQVAPNHPRYSKLGNFNVHAPVELTEHLGIWNSLRLVRLIQEDKELFELTKEYFIMSAKCLNYDASYLQQPFMQWISSFDYPEFHDKNRSHNFTTFSTYITQLYESLGVDTSDWSMDFQTGGRFGFTERFGLPSNIRTIMQKAIGYGFKQSEYLTDLNCSQLQKLSSEKLQKAFENGHLEEFRKKRLGRKLEKPEPEQILARCIRCHSEEKFSGIPYIPFDKPEELAAALLSSSMTSNQLIEEIEYRTSEVAPRKEQMPPGRRLSPEEHKVLIDYLQGLIP